MASGAMWLSQGAGRTISTRSPSATRARASCTTTPPTRTAPSAISRASRVRESAACSGASRASALSRRGGGAAPMTKPSGSGAMSDTPQPVSPATLKFLARLVTVLTATMIVGLLVITGLLVTRLGGGPTPLALPDAIALPDGARATAFTRGAGWYAVVTDDDRILVYDAESGRLSVRCFRANAPD